MTGPAPIGAPGARIGARTMGWVWVTVAAAVALLLAQLWMDRQERQVVQHSTDLRAMLSMARQDLTKGYLQVSLAGRSDQPLERAAGLALVEQAAAGLRHAAELEPRDQAGSAQAEAVGARLSALSGAVERFRALSEEADQAGGEAGRMAERRSAFQDLERQADQVTSLILADFAGALARHDRLRSQVAWGAALLLLVICLAASWSARAEQRLAAALREGEATLRGITDTIPDPIFLKDLQGRWVFANPATLRAVGRTSAEVLGKGDREIFPDPRIGEALVETDRRVMASGLPETIEEVVQQPDGVATFLSTKAPFRAADGRVIGLVGIARDVSELRRLGDRERRRERALLTLTRCSEVLVRASGEQELLDQVCAQIVEVGGHLLCWVGWLADDGSRAILPAARAGRDEGYVDGLEVTWDDVPKGRGPTGTAARTGRVALSRDVMTEPTMAPWSEAARQRAFRSSCALPLRLDGRVAGVVSIYSGAVDAFDEEERALLTRLVDNLAFGVSARRTAVERVRAEQELHRSREDLRALAARLDSVREEEQTRIARDLHDDLGQLLTGLRVDLDQVEELVERLPTSPESGAILDRVVDASALVARTVAATRHALAVLRPATLDLLGLVPALRQACRDFTARTGIPCEAELPPEVALDADAELVLFRIAQEALTNVSRHAAARRVGVALQVSPGALLLRVVDDGAGLPPAAGVRRGLGIVGMRERASRLGGELRVTPAPGGGTMVEARLPRSTGRTAEGAT